MSLYLTGGNQELPTATMLRAYRWRSDLYSFYHLTDVAANRLHWHFW